MRLFGSVAGSSAFTFLCSVGMSALIFLLGKKLFDVRTGFAASLLMALFPLDILYGTRVLPDVPLAFFSGLGVLFFLYADSEAEARGSRCAGALARAVAAGLFTGMAYLCREVGVLILVVLLPYAAMRPLRRGPLYLAMACGFALVFGMECVMHWLQCGDPLMRSHICAKVFEGKSVNEWIKQYATVLNYITVVYPSGYDFTFHLKRLVGINYSGPLAYFGWSYRICAAALVLLAFRKAESKWLLIPWLLGLLAYLEIGPIKIDLSKAPFVSYLVVFKEVDSSKFCTVLTLPALLIDAWFLLYLYRYRRRHPGRIARGEVCRYASVGLAVILAVSLLADLKRAHAYFRDGLADMRAAAEFFDYNPQLPVYCDGMGTNQLRFFLNYEKNDLCRNIQDAQPDSLHNAYLLTGGGRGVELCFGAWEKNYPAWVEARKDRFIKLAEFPADRTPYRSRPMVIYLVP
jgi:hypothetical protein